MHAQKTQVQKSQLLIEVLKRLAQEIDESAVYVDDLSQLVALALHHGVDSDPSFVHAAQSVDILHQRLSCLSHYLQELAVLTPTHWVVESHTAAKKLKLSKLADRLSHLGEESAGKLEHHAGEVEFY